MTDIRHTTTGTTGTHGSEIQMYLPEHLHEIRSRELMAEAHRHRIARDLTAGRWWRRIADYAAARAERAAR
ncbi:hypothetical protein [Saccharopolyspora cebuensis]|uniref:Uncharacterized protein n=1 Tax=Saccharopolyspora cebuensis TaxID=418759 RepID=A0ABV4CQG2_9PSEU